MYFSEFTVIHDASKQIEQRARIGNIFARWHFAIATVNSYYNIRVRVIINRGSSSFNCSQTNGNGTLQKQWYFVRVFSTIMSMWCINSSNEWFLLQFCGDWSAGGSGEEGSWDNKSILLSLDPVTLTCILFSPRAERWTQGMNVSSVCAQQGCYQLQGKSQLRTRCVL